MIDFALDSDVDPGRIIKPKDSAKTKLLLSLLGHYDSQKNGVSDYADQDMINGIKSFQAENNLKVDGWMRPSGPTFQAMTKKIYDDDQISGSISDFGENYTNMVLANTIGGDKYFHCLANYASTARGELGEMASNVLSTSRELLQDFFSIFTGKENDGKADQEANQHGRDAAKSGTYKTAEEACAIFRPKGLPERF
jgi:hypothetical protein